MTALVSSRIRPWQLCSRSTCNHRGGGEEMTSSPQIDERTDTNDDVYSGAGVRSGRRTHQQRGHRHPSPGHPRAGPSGHRHPQRLAVDGAGLCSRDQARLLASTVTDRFDEASSDVDFLVEFRGDLASRFDAYFALKESLEALRSPTEEGCAEFGPSYLCSAMSAQEPSLRLTCGRSGSPTMPEWTLCSTSASSSGARSSLVPCQTVSESRSSPSTYQA